MFLGAIAGHQPGPDAVAVASVAFELIHDAVSSATDDGELVNDDVEAMTMALWGLVHGLVSLELLGGRPSSLQKSKRLEDRAFDVAIEVALRGMTP